MIINQSSHKEEIEDTCLPSNIFHEDLEFEVTFNSPKLGLVLRKAGGHFTVDSKHAEQNSKHTEQIHVGDMLLSINGEDINKLPFKTVIHRLSSLPRPIKVIFRRRHLKTTAQQVPALLMTDYVTNASEGNRTKNENVISTEYVEQVKREQKTEESSLNNNAYVLSFASGQPNGKYVLQLFVFLFLCNLFPSSDHCSCPLISLCTRTSY